MDRIATIYGQPLIRGLDTSVDRALKLLKTEVLKRVQRKLLQSTFSERAKRAFSRAITVSVGHSSLTIGAKHPAFALMLKGQRKGQMKWLTKARAPIPIITETGELIFRNATPRSMKNRKWIHPGRAPYDFVEKAKVEAKAAIRKRVLDEIRKTAKSAAAKGRRG